MANVIISPECGRPADRQVPVGDYELPLRSAEVVQEGADVTVVVRAGARSADVTAVTEGAD